MLKNKNQYLLYLPLMLTLGITVVYPLIYSLYISFFSYDIIRPYMTFFVGFRNYSYLLRDPVVIQATINTIIFVLVSVGFPMLTGVSLALLIHNEFKKTNLLLTFLLFPVFLTPIAAGFIWRWLYNPDFGLINYFLELLGLAGLDWLGQSSIALLSIIIVEVWRLSPFVLLLTTAGIRSLPTEPFEAAKVDGASYWQTLRYVTLPYLKPVLFAILVLRTIDAFKAFDVFYVLTQGGPGTSTEILSLQIYKQGLKYFELGRSAATTWLFLILLTLISMVLMNLKSKEYSY